MSSFKERILHLIDREALVPSGGRVLVAVSGGADSVALVRLLHELAPTAGFTLVGLAHLNHQLRPAADEDEQFCRDLATYLSLPIDVEHADVAGLAEGEGCSVEEAGHRVRYAFFERAVRRARADRIATAHTRDDQAETYLMRIVRGAGPDGLAGIHPRAGTVVRPLLDVRRSELRSVLAQLGQHFREDESNTDVRVTRNRVRHELLPLLEKRFSPSIVDVLAREAAIARADAECLDVAARRAATAIVGFSGQVASLDVDLLARQPSALARRIVKAALERAGGRGVGFDHVERLLDLARASGPLATSMDFPGATVERRDGRLTIAPARDRSPQAAPGPFAYDLSIPGEVAVPEAGLSITASPGSRGDAGPARLDASGSWVALNGGAVTGPLIVRNWRRGDALRPLGLNGHKKLQDLFVDRKVARSERHTVPVVADKKGSILWVVGHTVAEDFRVTADTEGMLILKVRKLGGTG